MSKHILSSCTTLPLCITLHSIPSCENVITPFCENVITGSNLNRNKDPHESSTSPRSNKTGHKQTDYFLFCWDPLHVIFQLTWKNESKVAVVTWRAGNTRAISSDTRARHRCFCFSETWLASQPEEKGRRRNSCEICGKRTNF